MAQDASPVGHPRSTTVKGVTVPSDGKGSAASCGGASRAHTLAFVGESSLFLQTHTMLGPLKHQVLANHLRTLLNADSDPADWGHPEVLSF